MIADDLGYGDVSSLGNHSLPTPNIDRIGQKGITLTQHLTAASVCTPSRSAFLTGRYPVRNGMTSPGKNRVFFFVASSGGLPSNEITFAKSLKSLNYSTGLFGKWHLGLSCGRNDFCHHPNRHGFDYYFGLPLTNLKDFGDDGDSVITSYIPYFNLIILCTVVLGLSLSLLLFIQHWTATSILFFVLLILLPLAGLGAQRNIKTINSVLFRNEELVEQPVQLKGLTDRLVDEASEFIRNQTKQNASFLVMVNFIKVHTAHAPSEKFEGKSDFGKYGDCVMEMDYGVGRLLDLLEELSLTENTFTYFSSDNGAHLEEVNLHGEPEGGSNGPFPGGKGHGAMEGGIRVPGLVMWPKVLPASRIVSAPTMQMDIFTTIHSIVEQDLPENVTIDGRNILPLLKAQTETSPHEVMFHYCGTYLHGARFMDHGGRVYKVTFVTPKYKPFETKCQFVCMCYGNHVIEHHPPIIEEYVDNPFNAYQLTPGQMPYIRILTAVNRAIEQHQNSLTEVPSQFSLVNSIWKPWLQPCCNFPRCHC